MILPLRTLVIVGCLIALSPRAAAPQSADPLRVSSTGAARISGVVVTASDRREPVRSAVVVLRSEAGGQWSLVTGNDGRFAFVAVPAGRFQLRVSKPGFIDTTYGATSARGEGTPVALMADEAVDVSLAISRGAAIEGRLLSETGEPLSGVMVSAVRLRSDGEPLPAGEARITDDRGIYRLFGLPAGDYLVLARHLLTPDIERPSTADVDARLAALARGGGGSVSADSEVANRNVSKAIVFAPSYFPGIWAIDRAVVVSLGAGGERLGVDFAFVPVAMGRIEGHVSGAVGSLRATQVHVQASTEAAIPLWSRTVRPDETGRFVLPKVPPGRFTITARADPRPAAPVPAPGPEALVTLTRALSEAQHVDYHWARADVELTGGADGRVALGLAPGARVEGRVRFDASEGPAPADFTGIRVTLAPAGLRQAPVVARGGVILRHEGRVRPDGSFVIGGIGPGTYAVRVELPAALSATGWWPRSLVVRGSDWLDAQPTLEPGVVLPDAVIAMSNRHTTLSGTLRRADGVPAAEYFVVAFSADSAHWQALSRRTHVARPATNGRFEIRGLPPGEYLLGAVTSIDPDELLTGTFFQQLATVAIHFELTEGETHVQDLQIAQ